MSAIQKRKRISKKNKSAWRKTDIKDVEQFLEDQRQEERIGSFKEKTNEELFRVDSTPQKVKPTLLTEKQKRKLNATKPFRSWEAIENTSKVQDPIAKRNKVIQKKNGRNIEEEVRNPTKPRHFQANKDRTRYYQDEDEAEKQKGNKSLEFAKDIWADKDFRDNIPGLKDEKGWISRELSLYHTKNMGKPVIKVHDSIRHRTTKAKNFEAPHPGTSYNPSLKDHQDLINQVVHREEKIIKEEKHLKRVTTEMFSKVTPEARDRQRLIEMQSGLDDDEENDHDNEDSAKSDAANDASEAQYVAVNPPVENKKKTKQARRKELKQKELQKKQLEKKALKKQIADLHRIKSLKAEVLAEEGTLNELKKHRQKVELKKKFEPKRLARLKFEEPDADVNMAEDIAGNLRNVKTESSLLIDRFKNFQKRNILPTSVHKSQKKHKVKRFTRNTHKEPGVSHQMLRERKKALNAK